MRTVHTHMHVCACVYWCTVHDVLYPLYSSHGFIFAVFADWKPSAKVDTCENLDWVLLQRQNMAVHEC